MQMSVTLEETERALAYELWKRGEVGAWYLKPKQLSVRDFIREVRDPFVEASRRFGKTNTVLTYCMEEGAQRPGIVIRWCEPWKNQCREIVMPEIDQIQRDVPLEERWRWHQTDSYYEHPVSKSRLYLRGVNDDRGESARGAKAHIIVADELGSWRDPKYVIDEVLRPQLLTTKGTFVRIGTPPRNLTHLYYTMKERSQIRGAFIQRTVRDQELVDWSEIEHAVAEMGGWDTAGVRRELLCEKIVDKNFAIIPEWDDRYVGELERTDLTPFWVRYGAIDIGVRDLSVCLFAYWDFQKGVLYVEDEVVMNGATLTTERFAEEIRKTEELRWGIKYKLREDHNGANERYHVEKPPHFRAKRVSDIDLLFLQDMSRIHGLYFDATDKGALEEMVNEVRIWVAKGRIMVHPRCSILLDTLRYGIWDEKRKEWERTERIGHCDALAALMYMVRNVNRAENPIPADYQKPASDFFYTEKFTKTPKKDKWAELLNTKRRA